MGQNSLWIKMIKSDFLYLSYLLVNSHHAQFFLFIKVLEEDERQCVGDLVGRNGNLAKGNVNCRIRNSWLL